MRVVCRARQLVSPEALEPWYAEEISYAVLRCCRRAIMQEAVD